MSACQFGQLFGLIGAAQGFDHFVHVAGNDLVELVQGQIDAVIGEPALRKVVGADAFTAVARTDQRAAMVGRHLIGAEGTYWQDGPLTRAVREGGICYLDEVVEARKDTTVVLHPLSDHRRILPIERTGELLHAHPDFMLVISYNPGYQNLMKGLKPSTRQRFVALSFDYPSPELEVVIVCQESGLDKQTVQQLVPLGNDLRRLKDHDLEEAASTRLLIYTALMIRSGLPAIEACQVCLAQPLTDDNETLAAIDRLIKGHF